MTGDRNLAVVRRSGLTDRQFVTEYVNTLTPVIVTDGFDHWAARTRWSLSFFREHYGSRLVEVDGVSYSLSELIDRVERSTPAAPAPYLHNLLIEGWAPELLADILPLPHHTRPNWLDSWFFPERPSLTSLELYIGGAGAVFPVLHYDNLHTHAFLMQICGSKEYIVYSPDQSAFMYPQEGSGSNKSSVNDPEHADLTRFPLFSRARPSRCVLRAGEMLFVPAGWWHSARILEPTITVSANTVNRANWTSFANDYSARIRRHRARPQAAVLTAYMRLFGFIAYLVTM
jgi:cupin-like protein